MITYSAPDFTRHPPRSPRVRLGGYVHLPRLLDKARACAAGKLGDYEYACPLDKRFFTFTGLNSDEFLAAVKSGKGDVEMLAWVNEHTKPMRAAWEIEAWSRWLEALGPGDVKRYQTMSDNLQKLSPGRDDIRTNFDRLDLDDYISYGGKA
jgi:hypothetical protein